MMTSSAVKANVGASRKKALDVKLKKSRNVELEAIQEECYQELVMVRDSLATEFGIKAASIVSLDVSLLIFISTLAASCGALGAEFCQLYIERIVPYY